MDRQVELREVLHAPEFRVGRVRTRAPSSQVDRPWQIRRTEPRKGPVQPEWLREDPTLAQVDFHSWSEAVAHCRSYLSGQSFAVRGTWHYYVVHVAPDTVGFDNPDRDRLITLVTLES